MIPTVPFDVIVGFGAGAALAQIASGAAWGLLPLLAMPHTVEWQVFLGALTLGIVASNALFSAEILGAMASSSQSR